MEFTCFLQKEKPKAGAEFDPHNLRNGKRALDRPPVRARHFCTSTITTSPKRVRVWATVGCVADSSTQAPRVSLICNVLATTPIGQPAHVEDLAALTRSRHRQVLWRGRAT
jgi:hypothetical protein